MEILESADPQHRKLLEEVRRRKEQLDSETGTLSRRSEKVVRNALIIGGVLLASYLVYRAVSGGGKKEKPKESTDQKSGDTKTPQAPSMISVLGRRLGQVAAIFVLNLARERIAAWLTSKKSGNETA